MIKIRAFLATILLILCSCAGNVPVPQFTASNSSWESKPNLSMTLKEMDQRLQLLEDQTTTTDVLMVSKRIVWACTIDLPFEGGKFVASSANRTAAMYQASEKCAAAGNSRMKCEFNVNCFEN